MHNGLIPIDDLLVIIHRCGDVLSQDGMTLCKTSSVLTDLLPFFSHWHRRVLAHHDACMHGTAVSILRRFWAGPLPASWAMWDISTLTLSGNDLTSTLPEEWGANGSWANLNWLDLQRTQITGKALRLSTQIWLPSRRIYLANFSKYPKQKQTACSLQACMPAWCLGHRFRVRP